MIALYEKMIDPQVHPRIRGEYEISDCFKKPNRGSPPHPRGISFAGEYLPNGMRFTPASAGNIVTVGEAMLRTGVHPRIRGEYNSCSTVI